MACNCQKSKIDTPRTNYIKQPEEPCVKCAEKHFATAYALACENGYTGINRARVIGELVLCAWHIWQTDRHTAELLRDLRHIIQHRRENDIVQAQWADIYARLEKFALDTKPPPL